MKRDLLLLTFLVAAGLVGLMLFFSSPLAVTGSPMAFPTGYPTPRTPGDLGDICSIKNGCYYQDGIGIEGKANKTQLLIQSAPTQTAPPLVVNNASGTNVFAVSAAGGISSAVGIQSSAGSLTLSAGDLNVTGAISETGNMLVTGNIHATVKINSDATIGAGTTITAATSVSAPSIVGTTSVSGADISASGNISATGNVGVGKFLVLSTGTSITVTDALTLTPTASYQPLAAAGAVSTSQISTSGFAIGTLVRLMNNSNQAITLANANNFKIGANAVLGQYDTILLMFNGMYWVKTAAIADN